MKIGIIHNKQAARKELIRIATLSGQHDLVWATSSGVRALQFCHKLPADLIILDPYLRDMDGIQLIRIIMSDKPCAILIVSSSIEEQSGIVFEALGAGAIDAVNTPIIESDEYHVAEQVLLNKIDKLAVLVGVYPPVTKDLFNRNLAPFKSNVESNLVVIGSSSGGPDALASILGKLPEDYQSPIVIVQHVDQAFAPGLAKWLNDKCVLPVALVNEGSKPTPGKVLLAGTNDHLVLNSKGQLHYSVNPLQNSYRPSVDVFYQSVADHWRHAVTAVLLTGMGEDGANGMLALRRRGAYTIAQDEASSVVFGMPKAAIDKGAAVDILPIDKIAGKLLEIHNANLRQEELLFN